MNLFHLVRKCKYLHKQLHKAQKCKRKYRTKSNKLESTGICPYKEMSTISFAKVCKMKCSRSRQWASLLSCLFSYHCFPHFIRTRFAFFFDQIFLLPFASDVEEPSAVSCPLRYTYLTIVLILNSCSKLS